MTELLQWVALFFLLFVAASASFKVWRIEQRGLPRPGRCGAHPDPMPMHLSSSALTYSCEHDAGHAGLHKAGTMEWGKVRWTR